MRTLGFNHGFGGPATAGAGVATDVTPDAFSFTDQTDVVAEAVITSNSITATGINHQVTVTITGGTYSKNGAAYTSAAGVVSSGDQFTVRHTASASGSTATNTELTIGGVSDTFTSTTVSEGPSLGPELVVNGSFASNSDWVLNDGNDLCTISGGKLRGPTGGDDGSAYQTTSFGAGTYRTLITIDTAGAGGVQWYLGGVVTGTLRTTPGTYEEDVVYAGDGDGATLRLLVGPGDGGIGFVMDDASVKEVL